jgi:hypothetical protein
MQENVVFWIQSWRIVEGNYLILLLRPENEKEYSILKGLQQGAWKIYSQEIRLRKHYIKSK